MRRLFLIASLALLFGCDGPLELPSQVSVRTNRATYTDTSTLVVTVKNLGSGMVGLVGCRPPLVDIQDSVGRETGVAIGDGYACPANPTSLYRLGPGDSVVGSVALPGLMPGAYRALIEFGINGGGPTNVAGAFFDVR